jgi:hypothetical protein
VPAGRTRHELADHQRPPRRPARQDPDALACEIRGLATLGVSHIILESRVRDLDDMTAIYEKFARETRPKI